MSAEMTHVHLVGGWPTPLKKYESQLGLLFPIYGKSKKSCSKPPTSHGLIPINFRVTFWKNLGLPSGLLTHGFHRHLPALLCKATEELSDELWFLPEWLVHGEITSKNHCWLGGCQHQKYGHSTIKHAAIPIAYKELFSSKHVDLSDWPLKIPRFIVHKWWFYHWETFILQKVWYI